MIRMARKRVGLTQAELAVRVGTHQPVISAYENGAREPSIETLRRIVGGTGTRLRIDFERSGTAPNGMGCVDDVLTTPRQHADALVDVLLLADAIPATRLSKHQFPRIDST